MYGFCAHKYTESMPDISTRYKNLLRRKRIRRRMTFTHWKPSRELTVQTKRQLRHWLHIAGKGCGIYT